MKKPMTAQYDRHSTVPIFDVLYHIRNPPPIPPEKVRTYDKRVNLTVLLNNIPVGVSSLRLRTFAEKGTTCSECGLEASYFAIEREHSAAGTDKPYHLNLWGVNAEGEEILFTHDHVLARALGGADTSENSVPMCGPCNWRKSELEGKLTNAVRDIIRITAVLRERGITVDPKVLLDTYTPGSKPKKERF